MKKQIYLIDTSAILSGKNLTFPEAPMVTTPAIADEISPGGRDYRTFQLLREKGLIFMQATTENETVIQKKATELGESTRLSPADISLLALAYELTQQPDNEIFLLTDDYAMQNIAAHMKIQYKSISQRGITKKFKWSTRCPGCGKHFQDVISICPICGTQTQFSSLKQGSIKKS